MLESVVLGAVLREYEVEVSDDVEELEDTEVVLELLELLEEYVVLLEEVLLLDDEVVLLLDEVVLLVVDEVELDEELVVRLLVVLDVLVVVVVPEPPNWGVTSGTDVRVYLPEAAML